MTNFDESKHPRDHGKFAPSGGSTTPAPGSFGGPPMPPYGTPEWQAAWQARWEASGIKGGTPTVDLEDHSKAEGAARMALAAGRVGSGLGFDPKNLTVTDKDYKFELNGHQHDAAGTHLDGQVKLYVDHLAPGQITEVMSHEVEHAKFQAFLDDRSAEAHQLDAIRQSQNFNPKTDPIGPNGMLRGDYAKQFPLQDGYTKIVYGDPSKPGQSDLEQLAKEDGCSPYSRDWWDAVKGNTATYTQGMHETLAEMAAARASIIPTADKAATHDEQYRFGSPPTAIYHDDLPNMDGTDTRKGYLLRNEPSPHWNALYDLVEKNWQEKHAMK